MRVLVTGGAGFLGSVLVPLLLQATHQVTILDTFLYGQTPLLDWCGHPGLEIIRDDVRHKGTVERLLRGADAVVPLACLTGAPACDRDRAAAHGVNLEAIRLMMRLLAPDQLVIYPNTNSGYGKASAACTEADRLDPLSLYGRLKISAEAAVLEGIRTCSFRFATLFGASPRMRCDLLVNDFTYRAATDGWLVLYEGHFRRSLLHVQDAARAILWALEGLAAGTLQERVYNAGMPDGNLTKRELCQVIRRQVLNFRWFEGGVGHDPDQRDYGVDYARILAEGWKPERTLEEGIAELLKAYRIVRREGFGNA